jgi:N-methylhydantoinase B
MNAAHLAAVNGRTSTCQRAADLVLGALAQAAPERVIAAGNGACTTASFAGIDPAEGRLWKLSAAPPARAGKDGLDGVHVHMTNTSNLPVEALEIVGRKKDLIIRGGRGAGDLAVRRGGYRQVAHRQAVARAAGANTAYAGSLPVLTVAYRERAPSGSPPSRIRRGLFAGRRARG